MPQILITSWSSTENLEVAVPPKSEQGYEGFSALVSKLIAHSTVASWRVVYVNQQTPIDNVVPMTEASDLVVLLGTDQLSHRSTEVIRTATRRNIRLVVHRVDGIRLPPGFPPGIAEQEWLKAKHMCNAWRSYSNYFESKCSSDCYQEVLSGMSDVGVLGFRER